MKYAGRELVNPDVPCIAIIWNVGTRRKELVGEGEKEINPSSACQCSPYMWSSLALVNFFPSWIQFWLGGNDIFINMANTFYYLR